MLRGSRAMHTARRAFATRVLGYGESMLRYAPMRPEGARSHAAFWTARGYREVPGLVCTMHWADLGEAGETPHRLQFWSRAL